jgi:tetratricopeptide (TPR) repeat protein
MTDPETPNTSETTETPVSERKPLGKAESAGLIGLIIGLLIGLAVGYFIWGSGSDPAGNGASTGEVTVESLLGEGLALQQSGQTAQAEAKYNEVLTLDASNKFALYNLGVIRQTGGDPAGSIDFYRRTLASDPAFTSARYNLALALRDTGDRAGAIAELELVLSVDPNGVGTLLNLGNLLVEAGDAERGQQLIDRANEISGGAP